MKRSSKKKGSLGAVTLNPRRRDSKKGFCKITPKHVKVDISDVEECASRCGSHFFDRETKRFFNSRIGQTAYTDDKGNAFFVTSEKYDWKSPRAYTVRKYDSKNCSFDTVGKFQQHRTARQAHKVAQEIALSSKRSRKKR